MDQFMRINLERDINEITKLIKGYMTKTYIDELTREVSRCEDLCNNNRSKEVQLLEALTPFLPVEKRGLFEEVGKMLRYEQVADMILPKIAIPHQHDGMRQDSNEQFMQEIIIKVLLFKIMNTIEKR
ncbi:hypothetical protein [Niameybacter massiliensis]|uniref:hypothetical protein n=1 Tax=Niameybacter massiliensis TaxID=1658108 RepID=UPI0006B47C93|nr:hypothetical protein [Niameybacter massiliensis]